ncbi:hypothetical protein CLG96_01215 [Sphingomonas oleivorans]|uniref:Outer membrane protein beta-barrel domain-containing protein n=1 Tax=Sphingomonas oleivorans TaxID=1735121 RepID=A0A2T5G0W1_9SPHN|nr:outer membrane beta-barrel protein [Sphingomonas oleivorans]PTQ12796.1 hypothetical protein CLG96_01215 [Sphingomonas oleivorans]
MSLALRHLLPALLLAAPAAAQAQGLPLLPHFYAGAELGSGSRGASNFGVAGTRTGGDDTSFDYGVFGGVELPSFPLGYFALEAGVGMSDGKTEATVVNGGVTQRVTGDAEWNWSGTARLGLNPIPGLAAYGIAGYGGEKVDVTVTNTATGASVSDNRHRDGLIYGVGARYTFGQFLGARVEYRQRETSGRYDPEQILGGLYLRF